MKRDLRYYNNQVRKWELRLKFAVSMKLCAGDIDRIENQLIKAQQKLADFTAND